MLNDMMSHFELFQPVDVDNAFDLLDRYGEECWTIAGGHDSLGWFKDRGKQPAAVIDLAGIAELHGIRETVEGIELGAMTTLTEVERHPVIQERFGLLAEAALMVASPQIRNSGTLGGNVVQDTRCWYYRFGLACYRAGGNTCYASAPEAMNREHAIFGANRCVAVTPSDPGPALVALEAEMVIRNSRGERVVSAEDFFMTPAVDIQRMTVPRARGSAYDHPHSQHLGRSQLLLREGGGPGCLGLPARERSRCAPARGRPNRRRPHRRGCRRVHPSAPDGRRRPRERPRPERGDRCHGGRRSRSGSGALAVQPLQGAAHGEPREEGRARRLRRPRRIRLEAPTGAPRSYG